MWAADEIGGWRGRDDDITITISNTGGTHDNNTTYFSPTGATSSNDRHVGDNAEVGNAAPPARGAIYRTGFTPTGPDITTDTTPVKAPRCVELATIPQGHKPTTSSIETVEFNGTTPDPAPIVDHTGADRKGSRTVTITDRGGPGDTARPVGVHLQPWQSTDVPPAGTPNDGPDVPTLGVRPVYVLSDTGT